MAFDAAHLTLERKTPPPNLGDMGPVQITPPINEDYWQYRVRVSETQAIVGFEKFSTIGIGFAQEEDWNTNLPFPCPVEKIYDHIKHNKGDARIRRETCLRAILMVQLAATQDRAAVGANVQPLQA